MKKLCICKTCKRRFLIEPGRDNCPKCGGVLFKTDLEKQYWDLYTEDQRATITRRLMAEMEQNEQDTSAPSDTGHTAAQDKSPAGFNGSGGAASKNKGVSGNGNRNPAVLLGTVALSILLVCTGIYFSGKYRKAASASSNKETEVPMGSVQEDSVSDNSESANSEILETIEQENRIELYRDADVLVTRDAEKEFPYTDEYGTYVFEYRVKNLSDVETEYKLEDFLVQGIEFFALSPGYIDAGKSADNTARIEAYLLPAAGISEVKDAAFRMSAKPSGSDAREFYFETDGYEDSAKDREPLECIAGSYAEDNIILRIRGVQVLELPGIIGPQFVYYLLVENRRDERLFIHKYDEESVTLNGEDVQTSFAGTVAPHGTALIAGSFPVKDFINFEEEKEFKQLELPLVISDYSGSEEYVLLRLFHDWKGYITMYTDSPKGNKNPAGNISENNGTDKELTVPDSADAAANYILSHTDPASEKSAVGSEADTGNMAGSSEDVIGKNKKTKPYVYKDMVIYLPEDAEVISRENGAYAVLYTKVSMDLILFKYVQTGSLDLSFIRSTTQAEMDKMMASMNIPGYDGLLSFSHSEIGGYPAVTCSFHMNEDSKILVTEKTIYLENGYYQIQTHNKTEENTETLKAAIDSVNLIQ